MYRPIFLCVDRLHCSTRCDMSRLLICRLSTVAAWVCFMLTISIAIKYGFDKKCAARSVDVRSGDCVDPENGQVSPYNTPIWVCDNGTLPTDVCAECYAYDASPDDACQSYIRGDLSYNAKLSWAIGGSLFFIFVAIACLTGREDLVRDRPRDDRMLYNTVPGDL